MRNEILTIDNLTSGGEPQPAHASPAKKMKNEILTKENLTSSGEPATHVRLAPLTMS